MSGKVWGTSKQMESALRAHSKTSKVKNKALIRTHRPTRDWKLLRTLLRLSLSVYRFLLLSCWNRSDVSTIFGHRFSTHIFQWYKQIWPTFLRGSTRAYLMKLFFSQIPNWNISDNFLSLDLKQSLGFIALFWLAQPKTWMMKKLPLNTKKAFTSFHVHATA